MIQTAQLNRQDVQEILALANRLSKSPTELGNALSGKRCTLLFTQSSTRTFVSFSFAAQRLGLSVSDVRQLGLTGMAKGEKIEDVLETIARNSDFLVIRHDDQRFIEDTATYLASRSIGCKIISAGGGSVEHPTQALSDLFVATKYQNQKIEGSGKLVFVGDIRRGRTALSFSRIMALWPNWSQTFCSIGDLGVPAAHVGYLTDLGVDVHQAANIDDAIRDVDILYMMRLQKEYGSSDITFLEYAQMFLTEERMARLPKNSVVLHPLPRGEELPRSLDTFPQAKYWEVVEASQTVRTAVFLWMSSVQ